MALGVLISCKDDKVNPSVSPLVGTWQLTAMNVTGCSNGENTSASYGCADNFCMKITMDKNGGYKVQTTLLGDLETDTGTYIEVDGSLEVCVNQGTECSSTELSMASDKKSFTLTDTDGATGCVTVSPFVKL